MSSCAISAKEPRASRSLATYSPCMIVHHTMQLSVLNACRRERTLPQPSQTSRTWPCSRAWVLRILCSHLKKLLLFYRQTNPPTLLCSLHPMLILQWDCASLFTRACHWMLSAADDIAQSLILDIHSLPIAAAPCALPAVNARMHDKIDLDAAGW